MNFAIVKQNIDLKDEKGYPRRVDMTGMITEFNGGTKVTMIDQNGEKHNVYLNGDMPPYTLANQWQPFSLGCANKVSGTSGRAYVAFTGFWQNRQPPQAPNGGYGVPQPPQTPNSSPPAPNNHPPQQNQVPNGIRMPDTYAYPPTPESQIAMRRNIALEAASRVAIGRTWPNPISEVLNIASAFYGWLEDGKMPVDEPEQEDDPSDFSDQPPRL